VLEKNQKQKTCTQSYWTVSISSFIDSSSVVKSFIKIKLNTAPGVQFFLHVCMATSQLLLLCLSEMNPPLKVKLVWVQPCRGKSKIDSLVQYTKTCGNISIVVFYFDTNGLDNNVLNSYKHWIPAYNHIHRKTHDVQNASIFSNKPTQVHESIVSVKTHKPHFFWQGCLFHSQKIHKFRDPPYASS